MERESSVTTPTTPTTPTTTSINPDIYIFTEIVNCAKIGKIALDSFHKYHDLPVHVFGNVQDFVYLTPNPNNILVDVKEFPFDLNELYKEGHLGTATLWAYLIKTVKTKHMIHFDSDDIFRSDIVNELITLTKSYDLIGPCRYYAKNPQSDPKFSDYRDVVSTNLFSFNRTLIRNHPFDILVRMCRGMYNPYVHPVIDFFDPVSFEILYRGGKVFFLDPDDVGGLCPDGSRNNKYASINNDSTPNKIDFGDKLVHFSSVGSGMFYYNNMASLNVPVGYVRYAIDRYALFCKIFYNEDLGIDLSSYQKLLEIKEWN